MSKLQMDRRQLLAAFVASTAAFALNSQRAEAASSSKSSSPMAGYRFFTSTEVKFMAAAVERIIPTDELGPGALEAGSVIFIDLQLAGEYGAATDMYKAEPWSPSPTPYQGYQLTFTPAQIYRISIAAVDRFSQATWGKPFAELTPQQQDEVLSGTHDISRMSETGNLPARLFFQSIIRDTRDGFFSDPAYGGNRNMIGWKLIGYPGAYRSYRRQMFEWNKPYVGSDPRPMVGHRDHKG